MGSSCSAGAGHQGFNELETVEGAQITETFGEFQVHGLVALVLLSRQHHHVHRLHSLARCKGEGAAAAHVIFSRKSCAVTGYVVHPHRLP